MTDSQNPGSSGSQQQPIVIKQGSGGTAVGLIIAALILAGGAIWAVSIWSDTQLKMLEAPAEAIKKGTEAIKEGMEGAADALKPGS